MASVYYFNRARGKAVEQAELGRARSAEDITSTSVTENTKGKGTATRIEN